MRIFIETERLRLRQFTAEDVDNLAELDSDPDVRRYLDMPAAPTREEAQQTLERFRAWYAKSDRHGFWAAEERASGAFMGWFHFRPFRPNPQEIELGYRLKQAFWNRGYATEGGRALLQKGFREDNAARIAAVTLEANAASQRVMQKLGMRLEARYLHDDRLPAVKYSLNREEWLTSNL